jgi:hypothetical protein
MRVHREPKRLALLKELIIGISRIAVLWNPAAFVAPPPPQLPASAGILQAVPRIESLVDRHVSVIVATDVVSAHAAKAATSTIPIVFLSSIDPVKDGLVASLNHPGANLTGVFLFVGALGAKRLEFLRAVVPKPKLIGVLINPTNLNVEVQLSDVRGAAREIGQDLLIVNASIEADLDAAFATFVQPYVRSSRRSPRGARFALCDTFNLRPAIDRFCRRLDELRNQHQRFFSPDGHLHRPDTQGHQARRLACRPADEVRVGHQPQDRESTRPDDPTVCPSASRRGDRIT